MNDPNQPQWTPPVQFTKRVWAGCAVLLLAVSFATIAGIKAFDARALATSHVFVEATVTAAREMGPNDDPTYKITYQFLHSDQVMTFDRNVPATFFETHPTGTTWTIPSHRSDPSIHDLFAGETRKTAWGFLAVSALMVLVGGIFTLSGGNLAALRNRFH